MMMFHNYPTAQFDVGSIGWEDDADVHYDLGDASNDGFTLIKVQLFRGRDVTKPLAKRAQGIKLVCHMNSMMGQRVPPKDTRCYIAIPAGMEETPGAGIIVGTVEKSTDGRLDSDRVVVDYGDQHVVIKGKSVSIQGTDGSFVGVGSPRSGGAAGVTIQANDGTGAVYQTGVAATFVSGGSVSPPKSIFEMTTTKVNLMVTGGGRLMLDTADLTLTAPGTGYVVPTILILGQPKPTATIPFVSLSPTMAATNPQILFGSTTP